MDEDTVWETFRVKSDQNILINEIFKGTNKFEY